MTSSLKGVLCKLKGEVTFIVVVKTNAELMLNVNYYIIHLACKVLITAAYNLYEYHPVMASKNSVQHCRHSDYCMRRDFLSELQLA